MRSYLKLFTIFSLACGTTLPAFAQDFIPGRAMRAGQMETVQSTFNAAMPLDETQDITTQQLELLRGFYKMASGSCAEVLATVADSCEIQRLTTGINLREAGSRGQQLSINGSVVMKVSFNKTNAKPAE